MINAIKKPSFICSIILHLSVCIVLMATSNFKRYDKLTLSAENVEIKPVKATLVASQDIQDAYKRQEDQELKQQLAAAKIQKQVEQAKQELSKIENNNKYLERENAKIFEANRKAKLEKNKLEEELKKQLEAKNKLADKIIAEKKRVQQLDQANKQRMVEDKKKKDKQTIDYYTAMYREKIQHNRILSQAFSVDLVCYIEINLLDDGYIARLDIQKSSGNVAYDDMQKNAIYKSAPFPVPEDVSLRNKLKSFVIAFKNNED